MCCALRNTLRMAVGVRGEVRRIPCGVVLSGWVEVGGSERGLKETAQVEGKCKQGGAGEGENKGGGKTVCG